MAITAEELQAAYDADCGAKGHVLDFSGIGASKLMVATSERAPYIECMRCGRVWLVSEVPTTVGKATKKK